MCKLVGREVVGGRLGSYFGRNVVQVEGRQQGGGSGDDVEEAAYEERQVRQSAA